jgi:hypothetical protein
MDIGRARNGGRLLHGLAPSYSGIEKSYRGKTMAEMDLPDIDLEGRVVIMTGADRGLGREQVSGVLFLASSRILLCHSRDQGGEKEWDAAVGAIKLQMPPVRKMFKPVKAFFLPPSLCARSSKCQKSFRWTSSGL